MAGTPNFSTRGGVYASIHVRRARLSDFGAMSDHEILARVDAFNRQIGYGLRGAVQNLIPFADEAHRRGLV